MAEPKSYHGIMVSSTGSDLEAHRLELKATIEKLGFHANVMETAAATADKDVIEDSLRLVRESAAFVGIISHRYGQTPYCSKNNPDCLSISELEFNEAMRLNLPILLFIMGDDHAVKKADVETDQEKLVKLNAFRERAKIMRNGGEVPRVYQPFYSRDEFNKEIGPAIGNLAKRLETNEKSNSAGSTEEPPARNTDTLESAKAPALRAKPRYLGSHEFVGRKSELETLDDWCAAADQHPMLLFEAIGGSGKSMVTWTWLNRYATEARDDWAGRFWFSFYEGGATMTSFCQEALAYITGQPVKDFRKERMPTLVPKLIAALQAQPWLLVLDGLERILVAYHRIDAPQMKDEDVETATDQIEDRDPRATINPQDEDLLRKLTDAAPSKILVTSRLTPQALFNNAKMPIPGVRREPLGGLRPPDAEALFRACGVTGDSKTIRDYLQRNCDCHPLVIGALAGLVNDYRPDRGNFDAWLADPKAGGSLNLADLDLTQRRNHILNAAIDALAEPERKLLQTLSLLQSGADYQTLKAFNPHLPPPPEQVEEPVKPEKTWDWGLLDNADKATLQKQFDQQTKERAQYLSAFEAWKTSPKVQAAPRLFDATLDELERRGLLQYDHGLKQYDLHPVVRGVASGQMGTSEKKVIGEKVVDHFSNRQHDPYENAESLSDVAQGMQVVATLTQMGNFDRAIETFAGGLDQALIFNLMAYDEIKRLLRPFFPEGWVGPSTISGSRNQAYIFSVAGIVLFEPQIQMRMFERALRQRLRTGGADSVLVQLENIAVPHINEGQLSSAQRLSASGLQLSEQLSAQEIFGSLMLGYRLDFIQGKYESADRLWARLDPMGRSWSRNLYRGGDAEHLRAEDIFYRNDLDEKYLSYAESLCRSDRNRESLCDCLALRGEWHLSRQEPDLAIEPLNEALRLYREGGQEVRSIEALLTLAQLRAKQSVDAKAIAERLDENEHHKIALPVAEIWQELSETDRAIKAALRAHKFACGSGEPYVFRYYLDRADVLLRELGETPPPVPQHDPANDEIFDWEDDIRALIEKTRKEREEREREEAEDDTLD